MSFNQTSNLQLQDRDEHEYKYILTTTPGDVASNLMIRAVKEGGYLETHLTLLKPVVGDAAAGTYLAERNTMVFSGRKFVENSEALWTYLDGIIGTGLSPAELVYFFSPERGGYYNFAEIISDSNPVIGSDIKAKHIDLDPFLYAGNPIFDYSVSYV